MTRLTCFFLTITFFQIFVGYEVVAFVVEVTPQRQRSTTQHHGRHKHNVFGFTTNNDSSAGFWSRPSLRLGSTQENVSDGVNDEQRVPTVVVNVALTRERGKNIRLEEKIKSILLEEETISESIQCHEIPCIAFEDGPDIEQLPNVLLQQPPFDYICITSPEAATVFYEKGWKKVSSESTTIELCQIVAVGKATEHTLKKFGFTVSFVPSKATAKTLVEELPSISDAKTTTVLYPASKRAPLTLQDGLKNRGTFHVTRLDTYDTVPAIWSSDECHQASKCQIVCFGSPSAVQSWCSNNSNEDNNKSSLPIAACIGETSAQACRECGWMESNIFYPSSKPGLDGWAQSVIQAAEYCYNNLHTPTQQSPSASSKIGV